MARAAAVLALALMAGPVAAQQEPARTAPAALAALVARGDSAWARDERAQAFASYDAVVRADSAYAPRALFRVGLLHAWANRFRQAIAAQRRYVRLVPTDLEGRVALGRTYAWASRFPESLAQYDSVLAVNAAYRDAVTGKAQALAWNTRIPEGERLLDQWLATHAEDVGAWTLLGQFRRWQGDLRAAESALERALAVAPADSAAREQMAWVRTERAPALSWQLVGAKDSERNTLWHREVAVQVAGWGNSRVGLHARLREASVTDGGAVVVPGVTASVISRPVGRAVTARAEVGAVQFPAALTDTWTRVRGAVRVSGAPRPGLQFSGGATREPFDEVLATASRAMMFSAADVDLAYNVAPRWQVGVAGSVGFVDGYQIGFETSRTTVAGALRYMPRRGATLALTHREVSWSEPKFGIFFAPQRWATTELALAGERTAELGLVLAGDLGVASQLVGFEGAALDHAIVPRGTMRLGYRVAPGREVLVGLTYANVAGAGAITAGDYRYGAATLTGRWTF